jgi:Zn-dependent M28 family amino/carboxypeptidase
MARVLPADAALADVELVFLATGAEEIGLAGAVHWLRAHAAGLAPERTVFVNLDSVGVGRGLLALGARGVAPGGRCLRRVVRSAAAAAGVPVRQLAILPGVGVDTMPISARGFASVTLLGRVVGRAAGRIHSARDEASHLSESALQDAAALVHEIARDVVLRAPRP